MGTTCFWTIPSPSTGSFLIQPGESSTLTFEYYNNSKVSFDLERTKKVNLHLHTRQWWILVWKFWFLWSRSTMFPRCSNLCFFRMWCVQWSLHARRNYYVKNWYRFLRCICYWVRKSSLTCSLFLLLSLSGT
jgi:hypothetical protein